MAEATTIPLSPQGRVSFPEVFEAKSMKEDGKKKYSLVLLFDPSKMDDDQKAKFRGMMEAAEKVCREKFKVGLKDEYKGKPLRSPFRKSEEKPDFYPPGCYFVRFSSMVKPGLVDGGKTPIAETSGEFYAGCWAHVTYTVYPFEDTGNRGVAFGLKNIQKTRDDESFGGTRTTPDDDFGVIEGSASASAVDEFTF